MNEICKTHIVPINITQVSLIGVHGEYPLSHANYFWLGNTRILNFWIENLKEANIRFDLKNEVKIRDYGKVAIIDDERIPKEWYHNELCCTGGPRLTVEQAKDIYEYLGDPTNEFEQYVDPKSYWEKRGATYSNGYITHNIVAKDRKLKGDWTLFEVNN